MLLSPRALTRFPVCLRSLGSASTAGMTAGAPAKGLKLKKKQFHEPPHVVLHGFHPLSTRGDLLSMLGGAVDTSSATFAACVDKDYYPNGSWLVSFDKAGEEANQKAFSFAKQFYLHSNVLKSGEGGVQAFFSRRVMEGEMPDIVTTADGNIDNCTLRLKQVDARCDEDMLRFLFQNFQLKHVIPFDPGELKRATSEPKTKATRAPEGRQPLVEYLLKFSSAEQAERAGVLFNGLKCYGVPLRTQWYDI